MTESAKVCDSVTAIRSLRRVLRVVRGMLAIGNDDVLRTDGKGLWTKKELLNHIDGVLALKVKK